MEQMELFLERMYKNAKKEKDSSPKKPAVRRRKKAAAEVENYYALLGVAADADLTAIKENYIKMIKKYPPESHAEKFRRIRQAYEVLQDEQKRKEYDILFLYGESVDDLLKEARSGYRLTAAKVKLLERAVKIDPFHMGAQLALAKACFIREGREGFEERFDIIKNTFSAQEWPDFWRAKIYMLLNNDYLEEAFGELRQLEEFEPRVIGTHCQLCLDVYGAVNRETELLAAFERYHQSLTEPATEDLIVYIGWIQIADILFREDKLPQAQRAAERFIRSFADRKQLAELLTEEYQNALDAKDMKCAKIFVDLARLADRDNKKLKQYSQELQTVVALIDEITRTVRDGKIFPPIIIEAASWIVRDFDLEDSDSMIGSIAQEYDENMCARFEDMVDDASLNEIYAAGIFRIKKKYPLLYRQYQAQWEKILREKTMGMNREERRSFR